jgi:phage gpG-like protein
MPDGVIISTGEEARLAAHLARASMKLDPEIHTSLEAAAAEIAMTARELAPKGSRQHRGMTLAESIKVRSGKGRIAVGTYKRYARIQEFGGVTKAHHIAPRKKKALAFDGTFAKSVAHPGGRISGKRYMERAIEQNRESTLTQLREAADRALGGYA